MHRAFISTVVATALAFTGISSSMAQAGEYRYAPIQHRSQNQVDPLAATIAGLAALVIIGKAIDNSGGFKKKSHGHKQYVEPKRHKKHQRAHNGHRAHRGHGGHRQHGHHARRAHRGYEWHRHGNGHGHKHPHGPRHHRGRH